MQHSSGLKKRRTRRISDVAVTNEPDRKHRLYPGGGRELAEKTEANPRGMAKPDEKERL